jgi:hypothetical protein
VVQSSESTTPLLPHVAQDSKSFHTVESSWRWAPNGVSPVRHTYLHICSTTDKRHPGSIIPRSPHRWQHSAPSLRGSSQHSCLNHRWGMALVSWLVHLLVSPISRPRGRRAPAGGDGAPSSLVHGLEDGGIEDPTDSGINGAEDVGVGGRTDGCVNGMCGKGSRSALV